MNTIEFALPVNDSKRAEALLKDLRRLPDVRNADTFPAYKQVVKALERQKAIALLKRVNEDELRTAFSALRNYVASHWTQKEIPNILVGQLNTW